MSDHHRAAEQYLKLADEHGVSAPDDGRTFLAYAQTRATLDVADRLDQLVHIAASHAGVELDPDTLAAGQRAADEWLARPNCTACDGTGKGCGEAHGTGQRCTLPDGHEGDHMATAVTISWPRTEIDGGAS